MYTPPPLPIPILSLLVSYGIGFLIIAMLVRGLASFFPGAERFAFIRFLSRLTDPFIMPMRRVIGQIGILDLSFVVAWFMLAILRTLLLQSLPFGW